MSAPPDDVLLSVSTNPSSLYQYARSPHLPLFLLYILVYPLDLAFPYCMLHLTSPAQPRGTSKEPS